VISELQQKRQKQRQKDKKAKRQNKIKIARNWHKKPPPYYGRGFFFAVHSPFALPCCVVVFAFY
jgi:hypothetical protein